MPVVLNQIQPADQTQSMWDTIKSLFGVREDIPRRSDEVPAYTFTTPIEEMWDSEGHVPYRDTRPNAKERSNLSTGYPIKLLKRYVQGSLERGLPVHTTVSQGLQESTAAKWDNPENPLHLSNVHRQWQPYRPNKIQFDDAGWQYSKEARGDASKSYPKDDIEAALNVRAYHQKRYGNTPKGLQAYQGLGWLDKGRDMWNGETQNAAITRPYYHRIKAIEATLNKKDNRRLLQAIEDITKNYYNPRQHGVEGSY